MAGCTLISSNANPKTSMPRFRFRISISSSKVWRALPNIRDSRNMIYTLRLLARQPYTAHAIGQYSSSQTNDSGLQARTCRDAALDSQDVKVQFLFPEMVETAL